MSLAQLECTYFQRKLKMMSTNCPNNDFKAILSTTEIRNIAKLLLCHHTSLVYQYYTQKKLIYSNYILKTNKQNSSHSLSTTSLFHLSLVYPPPTSQILWDSAYSELMIYCSVKYKRQIIIYI